MQSSQVIDSDVINAISIDTLEVKSMNEQCHVTGIVERAETAFRHKLVRTSSTFLLVMPFFVVVQNGSLNVSGR